MKKLGTWKLVLTLAVVLSYALTYVKPMWSFKFHAPQYPQGLDIQIYLSGGQGDVQEIDIINHYIGMQKLESAAQNERALAPYVLIALSLMSLTVLILGKKKWMRILSLPVMGFPIVFVVIFYFWLYRFGHDLNPAAPVKLAPFTPTILGTGIIGQFTTFALPGAGFYLAAFAAICQWLVLRIQHQRE